MARLLTADELQQAELDRKERIFRSLYRRVMGSVCPAPQPEQDPEPKPPKCTCDLSVIMAVGCQCGGI